MKNLIYIIFILFFSVIYGQKPTIQIQNQLIGVWTLVLVENINEAGSKTKPYGDHPVGNLIFTDTNYAIQILKTNRPKIVANDKDKATPEEYKALVQGNNSHFGTYIIDQDKKKITFNIKHAFYPNWEGTQQIRSYLLDHDTLTYRVTNTTNGGSISAIVKWKKYK